MIRLGLFLYLLLVTAAGPGACCCLADGIGTLLTKDSRKKSCCPNHGSEKKESPSKSPTRPCPCKEDRVGPISVWTIDKGRLFTPSVWQFDSACGSLSTAFTISELNANAGGNLRFTYLTGHELLRATHVLRC